MSERRNTASGAVANQAIAAEDWRLAVDLLEKPLAVHEGCVSSQLLRKELGQRGGNNARELCLRLRFYAPEDELPPDFARPAFPFHHRGRSSYSESAFEAAQEQAEKDVA